MLYLCNCIKPVKNSWVVWSLPPHAYSLSSSVYNSILILGCVFSKLIAAIAQVDRQVVKPNTAWCHGNRTLGMKAQQVMTYTSWTYRKRLLWVPKHCSTKILVAAPTLLKLSYLQILCHVNCLSTAALVH